MKKTILLALFILAGLFTIQAQSYGGDTKKEKPGGGNTNQPLQPAPKPKPGGGNTDRPISPSNGRVIPGQSSTRPITKPEGSNDQPLNSGGNSGGTSNNGSNKESGEILAIIDHLSNDKGQGETAGAQVSVDVVECSLCSNLEELKGSGSVKSLLGSKRENRLITLKKENLVGKALSFDLAFSAVDQRLNKLVGAKFTLNTNNQFTIKNAGGVILCSGNFGPPDGEGYLWALVGYNNEKFGVRLRCNKTLTNSSGRVRTLN